MPSSPPKQMLSSTCVLMPSEPGSAKVQACSTSIHQGVDLGGTTFMFGARGASNADSGSASSWWRSDTLGPYFPPFIFKFSLANIGPRANKSSHVYAYDFPSGTLHVAHRIPRLGTVFKGLHPSSLTSGVAESLSVRSLSFLVQLLQYSLVLEAIWRACELVLGVGTRRQADKRRKAGDDNRESRENFAVWRAEETFTKLEKEVEKALVGLLHELKDITDQPTAIPTPSDGRGFGRSPHTPLQHQQERCQVTAHLPARSYDALLRYFLFLRFRNSNDYQDGLKKIRESFGRGREALMWNIEKFLTHKSPVEESTGDASQDCPNPTGRPGGKSTDEGEEGDVSNLLKLFQHYCWRPFLESRVEITLGVAPRNQEFITTERGFGSLEEELSSNGMAAGGESNFSGRFFFPITPTVAVYLNVAAPRPDAWQTQPCTQPFPSASRSTTAITTIECVIESPLDVHIRNTALLLSLSSPSSHPHPYSTPHLRYAIFSSLTSLIDAAAVAINNLTTPNLQAPSFPPPSPQRLKTRQTQVMSLNRLKVTCYESHIQEGSTETLLVKHVVPTVGWVSSGSTSAASIVGRRSHAERVSNQETGATRVAISCHQPGQGRGGKTIEMLVPDLTKRVRIVGDCAAGSGSFADIWKGTLAETIYSNGLRTSVDKIVAIKTIRQTIIHDHQKERVLDRLKLEALTWYRLRHPHIAPLCGVVQMDHYLAMVSPWCKNGTVVEYLKDIDPNADKVKLMRQIASGVEYLHNHQPVVIHGDLKGNNILVDDDGNALITDFGISRVIEDFTAFCPGSSSLTPAKTLVTTFLEGALRWEAPETVVALSKQGEDGQGDAKFPELTKWSDVYAFGAVCFEIVTGQLPYPTRKNASALTCAKLQGVKPSSGVPSSALIACTNGNTDFWDIIYRCWDSNPPLRPDMSELVNFFHTLCARRTGVSAW